MMTPIPHDENERLHELDKLGILYTPAEGRYDSIVRLALNALHVKSAFISFLDKDVQWFKSIKGFPNEEVPRDLSICSHTIMDDKELIVPDLKKDDRFRDNPFVKDKPHLRFYAGYPLSTYRGSHVGTFCIVDVKPRNLKAKQKQIFLDLAQLAELHINVDRLGETQMNLIKHIDKLERKSRIDSLTLVWNRRAIFELLDREIERFRRNQVNFAVIMLDLDNFKQKNDQYGHAAGDQVLLDTADIMRATVRPYDAIGRYGGEEFLIILSDCDKETALRLAERLRASIQLKPVMYNDIKIKNTASMGVSVFDDKNIKSREALIENADKALYKAKKSGRNRIVFA